MIIAGRLLAWIIGSRSIQMAENPFLGESSPKHFPLLLLHSLSASSHALFHVFGSLLVHEFMEILVADLQPLLAEFQHPKNLECEVFEGNLQGTLFA